MAGGQPQILIVQSQAAAIAAATLLSLPAHAAVSFDWPSLAGRRVILWPTNTPLSLAAFRANIDACWQHGAEQVKLIEPSGLAAPGWDATMAAAEGWDRPDLLDWLKAHAVVLEAPVLAPEPPDVPMPDIRTEAEITGGEPAEPAPAVRTAPASADFNPTAPLVEQWAMLGLEQTKNGVVANEDTVLRVLERHPEMRGLVWYDEFLGRVLTPGPKSPREWTDADEGLLLSTLQRELGIARCRLAHVHTAVITRAFAQQRNCAQDWLRGLKWDQTERIGSFFPDFCGCADTTYNRAVGRNFFISIVARVLKPGHKADNMIILEGAQGTGKSSMLKALGGDWYTVQHEAVTGKGFFEVLQGKMLVEIAEMDAFGKAEVTRVKQVVSTESDRYREAYGRHAKDHPRHSIFAGTTNKDDWNRDETGARRFWPIRVEQQIDIAAVTKARPQLFAEAVAAYDGGAHWWVMPEAETREEQDARRDEDVWAAAVEDWLADIYRADVTSEQILTECLSIRRGEQGRPQQMRVASILRGLGWRKRNSAGRRYWSRPEKSAEKTT